MFKLLCNEFFSLYVFYFASKILQIICVELIVLSDLKHLSTYELIKDYSGLTIFSLGI